MLKREPQNSIILRNLVSTIRQIPSLSKGLESNQGAKSRSKEYEPQVLLRRRISAAFVGIGTISALATFIAVQRVECVHEMERAQGNWEALPAIVLSSGYTKINDTQFQQIHCPASYRVDVRYKIVGSSGTEVKNVISSPELSFSKESDAKNFTSKFKPGHTITAFQNSKFKDRTCLLKGSPQAAEREEKMVALCVFMTFILFFAAYIVSPIKKFPFRN